MNKQAIKKNIGIIGGGPSALFLYKKILDSGDRNIDVTIFEKNAELGAGMPYSKAGALEEHITNVSDNEIPELITTIEEWICDAPKSLLDKFDITPEKFNEYKVLPRLLFGEYLKGQFALLLEKAKVGGIATQVYYNTQVIDVSDVPGNNNVSVSAEDGSLFTFDAVIISTGHHWPKKHEGKIDNWFDSPYPPVKLKKETNYPVAIKGSSLTAIDAVRTLARQNGKFEKNGDSTYHYILNDGSPDFKLVLHSLDGLLPAIRFHLEDSQLSKDSLLSIEEVNESKAANGGFIPLDYIFEKNFLRPLQKQNPSFYKEIKDLTIEEFVDKMMGYRENTDAFELFREEYYEAEKSIDQRKSVYWKEMLAVLSYAMNYPAKHLSAEDMLRLKKVLMPLISIVIAFVPQSSSRELLALYDAGVLELIAVDETSKVEPADDGGAIYTYANHEGEQQEYYKMFIDAVGQPAFMFNDFIFPGLKNAGVVSAATIKFKNEREGAKLSGEKKARVVKDEDNSYLLEVPGVNIDDHFRVVNTNGESNPRIFIMAVPYISGLNPDYSGLDFCEEASGRIVEVMFNTIQKAASI